LPLAALRLTAPKAIAQTLANHLDEVFWPSPLSIALIEAAANEMWEIEAHFDTAPDKYEIAAAFGEALKGLTPPAFTITTIKDRDWVRQSQQSLTPVHAGRFVIHGAHDRNHIPSSAIGVQIDAGQAFGTGHHETTKGCLLALGEIVRTSRPCHILDVGTGSGVLAIAAAKLLKTPVLATDNDPIAIDVAKANARANGVAPLVRGFVAHGVTHPSVAQKPGHDLIFANILARPLVHMAGDISRCLARGGSVILSGILNRQGQSVLTAYRSRGLVLRRRLQLGDWTTFIVGKK